MLFKNRNTAISYACSCWLYAFFAILLFVVSCKHPADSKRKEYFNATFKKVDSSLTIPPFGYQDADIIFLDAAFATEKGADIADIANKYIRKIRYYWHTKADYSKAFLYADSCINLLQNQVKDEALARLCAKAFFLKGNILFKVKNYDEAIRNYTTGKLILSANVKDSCALYGYYESMANILYAQKKYLLAAGFFRLKYVKAPLCIENPVVLFMAVQENMDNVGICYSRAGLRDSALHYFNAALDFIDQYEKTNKIVPAVDFVINKAVVYSNMAPLLYQEKDVERAEKLFIESIEGTKTYPAKSRHDFQLPLASFYLETNQVKKAGIALDEITRSMDTAEISSAAGDYYKYLSDYYTRASQPVAANKALLHAYMIRDSLEKKDRQFNAIDQRREFESQEQKSINQKLRTDNEIKRGYLVIAVVCAIMAVIIIFMVWYNLQKKAAYINQLMALYTEVSNKNDDLHKIFLSLEKSHNENNRIIQVMAHDLKSPILAIRTLIFSLLNKEQPDENKEMLELIQATCIDSLTLIKDLLDNKRDLSDSTRELVDIGRLTEQCIQLFRAKAAEKNQHLKLQIDYTLIMINRQKIWRVISNIVNNAIKFSPENTEIMICLENKRDHVLLAVHDKGSGIPQEQQDNIFMIGPAILEPGAAEEKLYGLGLPISRKIIEEHKGKLWFESKEGKGSVFYVELPGKVN